MKFAASFIILRTIWPYDEGYGVLKKQFGQDNAVLCHGVSKDYAKQYKNTLEREQNEEHFLASQ